MHTTAFNAVTGAGATTNLDYLQIAMCQLAIFVTSILQGLGYALIWTLGLALPTTLGFAAVLLIRWMLRYKYGCWCMASYLGAVGTFLFQILFLLYLHAIIDLKRMESFSSTVLLGMSAVGTVVMLGVVVLGFGVWVQVRKLRGCLAGGDEGEVKGKVEGEGDGAKGEVGEV